LNVLIFKAELCGISAANL